MNIGGPEIVLYLLFLLIPALIFWRIFAKTGWPGAYGLLMLIPLVNLIVLLVLAFAEWPIEREVRELRERGAPLA